MSGAVSPTSSITDEDFLVNRDTIILYRKVEKFFPDGNWNLIASQDTEIYKSKKFIAEKLTIGPFLLDRDFFLVNTYRLSDIIQIASARNIILNQNQFNKVMSYDCTCVLEFCGSGTIRGKKGETHNNISSIDKDNLYHTTDKNSGWECSPDKMFSINKQHDILATNTRGYNINDNYIYIGNDAKNPSVNDLRISYFELKPQIFTVIGMQKNNSIMPIINSSEDLLLIEQGRKTLNEMLEILAISHSKKYDISLILGSIFFIYGIIIFFLKIYYTRKKQYLFPYT